MHFRLTLLRSTLMSTLSLVQPAVAQYTSSYWSLAGNSNAASSSKLGTTTAIDLRLFANNVERMRILSANGKVGIGTTTPAALGAGISGAAFTAPALIRDPTAG